MQSSVQQTLAYPHFDLPFPRGGASLDLVAPPRSKNSTIKRTSIDIPDPINIAFDTKSRGARGFNVFRLFLWDSDLDGLVCIRSGPRNRIRPSSRRRLDLSKNVDFQNIGIGNPQGMTLDPATRLLFLLDEAGERIISIKLKKGRHRCKAVKEWGVIDIPFSIRGGYVVLLLILLISSFM